jgi:hypothetical protein
MIKRQWLAAVLWRYWHDSRLVLWTWERLHERTRLEWKG